MFVCFFVRLLMSSSLILFLFAFFVLKYLHDYVLRVGVDGQRGNDRAQNHLLEGLLLLLLLRS